IAPQQRFGSDGNRHIESLTNINTGEARRRDADDLERNPFECYLAADDRKILSEFALPESRADDCDGGRRSALIVANGEHAAKDRSYTQHVEEVSADPEPLCVARLATLGHVEGILAPREHAGERFLSIADLFPDRIRDRRVRAVKTAPRAF